MTQGLQRSSNPIPDFEGAAAVHAVRSYSWACAIRRRALRSWDPQTSQRKSAGFCFERHDFA